MARVFLILNQPELELNGFRGQSIQLTFGLYTVGYDKGIIYRLDFSGVGFK
jgi:hypothetical protein